MRWLLRVVMAVVIVAMLFGGYCVYLGVSTSLHAENALHAAQLTLQLLDDFVAQHDGQWPRSWADLEALPTREGGMFAWPGDSREVQQYVTVEFSIDPKQLAAQSDVEFDAVRPIGLCYPFKDHGIGQSLIKSIRAHVASNEPQN